MRFFRRIGGFITANLAANLELEWKVMTMVVILLVCAYLLVAIQAWALIWIIQRPNTRPEEVRSPVESGLSELLSNIDVLDQSLSRCYHMMDGRFPEAGPASLSTGITARPTKRHPRVASSSPDGAASSSPTRRAKSSKSSSDVPF